MPAPKKARCRIPLQREGIWIPEDAEVLWTPSTCGGGRVVVTFDDVDHVMADVEFCMHFYTTHEAA